MANASTDVKEVSVVEAVRDFANLVNRVAYGRERIIITRRGRQLVAIVPVVEPGKRRTAA